MYRENCKEDIERWLRKNCKELVWKRASGDYPPKKRIPIIFTGKKVMKFAI